MIPLIEDNKDFLAKLCKQYRVKRLDVFGSAANGTFDPTTSDLDFLVEFDPITPGEHYECYFGLWESLQEFYGRRIDLVEENTLRNPYMIRSVNEGRVLLYAA